MKFYMLKLFLSFAMLLAVSGCYTVIWMPEDEFPNESSYNEYYSETYYGDYFGFYDYPWWLNYTPSAVPVGSDYQRDENGTTKSIRNEGQGRGSSDDRKIITTTPPSRDASSGSSSTTGSSSGNTSNNGSSVNSNNSSSNSRSSDNNSIRNSDGNRNSNSGRK